MMDAAAREPSIPEAEPATPRPWGGEPDAPDADAIGATTTEETPLEEPGYGHGV